MKKIVLLCNGGMSTSMMVTKMKAAAAKDNFDCEIAAYALASAKEVATDADCILVGPQVKFKIPQIQKDCPGVPIAAIEMKDYGVMNGVAVLKAARALMG
ncbi:MAG: PTS sugar transporter subunit IIB [Oscillospiraceae bacterium]|nr:PTS sugar transporter subunit IIB [Oscillospiraceae bacterium]